MAKQRSETDDWNRFVKEGLTTDGPSNVTGQFKTLTKKYGKAYISYLQAAWAANEGCLTEEEFCELNGDVPKGFFDKRVKT